MSQNGTRPDDAASLVSVLLAEYGRLVRLAAFLLNDPSDAQDVVQALYVQIRRNTARKEFNSDTATAYLTRSIVNACRSAARRRTVQRRFLSATSRGDDEHRPEYDPFVRQLVVAALRELPRREREVVVLRYYADYSIAEIADALRVSEGAVKSYSSRALNHLAPLLEELS